MSDDWVEQRDRAILETIYYCETCNVVLELGNADIAIHKRELPLHKMRRVMIVKCAHCSNIVTDSYAEYVQEKNEFWCKNCLFDNSPHPEARRVRSPK
jgi:DNA-directed RNA polymerase subunit RPC12/RpoP